MENYMDQFNKIAEESNSGGSGGGGLNIPQYVMKDHQKDHNICRLIGAPRLLRRAWILCDNDKKLPFQYTTNSIMQKIVNKVLAFEWVNDGTEKDPKWRKEYTHKAKYGSVFDIVKSNGTNDSMESGWEGSKQYPFNCIDREDTWCQDNKHTKLFVKSKYDIGISSQAFDSLNSNVVEDYGGYQGYDIDIKKVKNQKGQVSYIAMRADERIPEITHLVTIGDLTEEEKSYESYNLDEVARDSSAQYILKFLTDKITQIDSACGTDFLVQLKKQAETEEPDPLFNTSQSSAQAVKYEPTTAKSADGFSYDDMKKAGWSDEQLAGDANYNMLVKKVSTPPPKTPAPTPSPTPSAQVPNKPTPPSATPSSPATPELQNETIKVDGFTYEDMKGAGWSDDQLKADPKYKVFFPEPVVSAPTPSAPTPSAPSAPSAPTPSAPTPSAPTPSAPSAPASPSGDIQNGLPCPECGTVYPLTEQKCPKCGWQEQAT